MVPAPHGHDGGLSRRARRSGRLGAGPLHPRRRRLRPRLDRRARGLRALRGARFRPTPRQPRRADGGRRARAALRHREEAMSATSFALVLVGVLLNATAQLLLKAGTNAMPLGVRLALEPHILGGLACYAVSVVVWVIALSRVPVSIAYPMLSIGYVVNAIAAWQLLGESLSPLRLSGIGVIIVGVFMVARS